MVRDVAIGRHSLLTSHRTSLCCSPVERGEGKLGGVHCTIRPAASENYRAQLTGSDDVIVAEHCHVDRCGGFGIQLDFELSETTCGCSDGAQLLDCDARGIIILMQLSAQWHV